LRLFTETLKYGNNKNVYSSMGNTEYDLYRNESDPVKKEEHLNRAIANWEKTTRMNPNFAPPLKRLAHHYYMMGQMDSAEIYLKKSVRWDKGDMSSWKMYAQLLLKKEKNDEVLEALEFMRTLNKQRNGKPEGYYIQLAGLLVQRKRNSEAFTILNEYCGAFPTDLRAMTVFHRTALAMKNWEAARASLDKLYASKPEVKEFYIQKAMIYEQQEKYDKAYFELAMAYNKDTSDAQLRRMMEAMDHRRKK
jgi:tetratricopeptide (TPR) repeat protein